MFQVLLVGSMFQGLAECHRFRYVCESQGVLYGQAMMESGIQAVMENGIQTSGRGAWVTDGQDVYVIAYHRFRECSAVLVCVLGVRVHGCHRS